MYKLEFNDDEMSIMSGVLKFVIKNLYTNDYDDYHHDYDIYLQINALRNKISNAEQE